jgi:hypothetical protein
MLDATPATPEPFDNGPRLGVEIQVLSWVQQVLMRQQMMEETNRSQEATLRAKIDDLQNSIDSKVMCGFEQTQCLVGGLQMQLMNVQAQVQAVLMGQSQLQAQMLARQAAHASTTESRKQTKETPVLTEETPQTDVKSQAQEEAKTPSKRKRPGSRTRRRARSAYNSSQSLPEPLELIEDVASEEEATSAGSGEVANLAEFENMFDNFACSKDQGALHEANAKTDTTIVLPDLLSQHANSEFDAETSSCGGFSPSRAYGGGSFCLEVVDNPQECLSPLLDEALFSALTKLRNGEDGAASKCFSILEREDFTGINAKSQGGRTALHIAIRCQHEEVCCAILARPDFTEINAKYRGQTALTLAADKQLTGICLAILEREDFSEINAKTVGSGETALHKAAAKGLADVCWAIMNRADFHAVNASTLPRSMGCTAAEVAEGCGHSGVAEMIRTLGGR